MNYKLCIILKLSKNDLNSFKDIAKNLCDHIYFLIIFEEEDFLLDFFDLNLSDDRFLFFHDEFKSNILDNEYVLNFVANNDFDFYNFCHHVDYLNMDSISRIKLKKCDINLFSSLSKSNYSLKIKNNNDKISYEIFSLLFFSNMVFHKSFISNNIKKIPIKYAEQYLFLQSNLINICSKSIPSKFSNKGRNIFALKKSYDYFLSEDEAVSQNIIDFISDPKSLLFLFDSVPWRRACKILSYLFSDPLKINKASSGKAAQLPLAEGYINAIIDRDDNRLMAITKTVFSHGFRVATTRDVDFSEESRILTQKSPLAQKNLLERRFPAILRMSGGLFAKTESHPVHQKGAGQPFNFSIMENGGFGFQRDGWNFVLQAALEHFGHSEQGIGLDAFMEKSFVWNFPSILQNRDRPWIGIAHRPPNIPDFYDHEFKMQFYENPFFYNVSKSLMGIITMSTEHAEFLNRHLMIPTRSIIHPTNHDVKKWNPDRINAREIKLVQIGTWLRKMHSIYLMPSGRYKKSILARSKDALYADSRFQAENKVLLEQGLDVERAYSTVDVISFLSNEAYDQLLTECVIFLDLYDSTANNTILEAIARHTPIVVRRMPATVEYLTADYPLFFDSLEHAAELASDTDMILKAHHMLKELAQDERYHVSGFCKSLTSIVSEFEEYKQ